MVCGAGDICGFLVLGAWADVRESLKRGVLVASSMHARTRIYNRHTRHSWKFNAEWISGDDAETTVYFKATDSGQTAVIFTSRPGASELSRRIGLTVWARLYIQLGSVCN